MRKPKYSQFLIQHDTIHNDRTENREIFDKFVAKQHVSQSGTLESMTHPITAYLYAPKMEAYLKQ